MDEWTLNDLLECSVCLERLDTSSKVLPCQHTFCKKCLEEIVSTHKELRCPECRVLVDVKIEDLPPNVLLMRILEGMRNAAPKKRNTAPNRMQGGHFPQTTVQQIPPIQQQHLPSHASNIPQMDISTRAHPAPKQMLQSSQPYARAVYDYLSNEPGDLCFKKGDIILLRKKIDANWYHGESGGNQGVFPLTYVQVMTPLPSHVPQCKALYDFRMTNDDEEGCLTFNKGEVITVIRRVDENWAEGKLAERIGIFPLAFVELNAVARALMKLSTNSQPGPSRLAPPTPTSEDTTPLIPTDHSRTVATSQLPPASTDSSSTVSSASSSTTTPNTSSSNTSSSSSTAPSSPTSPPPRSGPPPNREKRHSFSVLHTGPPPPPSHRHSAEILSPAEAPPPETESGPPSQGVPQGAVLPAPYMALYPYKPQKADELELRKGGVYLVTERCQDGWFKGTSARTQKCGVFPGNYVAPAKALSNTTPLRSLSRGAGSPQSPRSNGAPVSYTRSGPSKQNTIPLTYSPRQHTLNVGAGNQTPPELPPRSVSPSHAAAPTPAVISSSWHGQPPQESVTPAPVALGRSHSAVEGRGQGLGAHLSTAVTPPPNVSVSAAPSPVRCDKTKEKKEKGVSLMRRLTSIKKSKSPPPATYSMDNPVFEDGTLAASPAHPVHVRSGSCPSQLLQVLPLDGSTAHHRLFGSGSQRLKHKERPNVVMANLAHFGRSNDSAACSSGTNQHRKSNSLDAGSGEAGRKGNKQLVPPVRERFRCIVPYPPNSEYELELRVGDIIYVHKKREDGWYKGTQQRTGRTGLFPASFVESF